MRARTASIVALALAAAWLCVAPADATALGTYVVHACRVNGAPAPLDGWSTEGSDVYEPDPSAVRPRAFNECGSASGFGIDDRRALGVDVEDTWKVTAPPDTRIIELRLDDAQISPYYPGLPIPWRGESRAALTALQSPDTDFGALDARSFSFGIDCMSSCVSGCPCPMTVRIPEAELTLRDDSPPTLSAPAEGTALQGRAVSGVSTVAIPFRDRGSGLSSVHLLVDGEPADSLKLGGISCVPPFVHLVPCPLGGVATVPLDTAGLSNGRHRLAAVLTDASGNTTSEGPFQIDVENPRIPPATGVVPIPAPAARALPAGRLTAGMGRHRAKRLRVAYAAPPVIRGRLRRSDGKPLAGAHVEWAVRPARAKTGFSAQPSVLTGRSGRFSIRLPRGPSRTIRLSYGSSTVTLRVDVRAPIRLSVNRHATRNGRRIRFRGSVLGAPPGARTLVELQAWADGRWTTFETAPLKRGRFSASYRFTRTFAAIRYRFRAVVRSGPQLPYATGWSKQVRVLVRP